MFTWLPRTRGDRLVDLNGNQQGSWLPRTRGDRPWRFEHDIRSLTRLPRTRGDRPSAMCRRSLGVVGCPAHVGIDPARQRDILWQLGCPAHVGIDLSATLGLSTLSGLPRTRGDRPYAPYDGVVGCPAHVGIDRCDHRNAVTGQAAPHTWGCAHQLDFELGCPAHVGIDLPLVITSARCPAHVGIDRSPIKGVTVAQRLPRTRGDRPAASRSSHRHI